MTEEPVKYHMSDANGNWLIREVGIEPTFQQSRTACRYSLWSRCSLIQNPRAAMGIDLMRRGKRAGKSNHSHRSKNLAFGRGTPARWAQSPHYDLQPLLELPVEIKHLLAGRDR